MKKLYNAPDPGLLVGVPYTWGVGEHWYVLLDTGVVVYLNDFTVMSSLASDKHRKEATIYQGFRYAQSMEIL